MLLSFSSYSSHILHRHPLSISTSVISWSADLRSRESFSISTNFSPRSLPKMTACKHAMTSASNPKDQIAHMAQMNF
ncbi:hypothetical protein ES332_A07G068400v1 [Gossypium tomentosum]|uniref:Uncharacterized protein n=1 Tax=Gossypium tomentosum TaxID=34277 RepID=A0A5D2PPL0_GOSTO|nr:hypothetical protein ES332_A07G068400v1 [Gossypium tomentosum]